LAALRQLVVWASHTARRYDRERQDKREKTIFRGELALWRAARHGR
jgi:hypothetical protein